jgi:hypothetical protein
MVNQSGNWRPARLVHADGPKLTILYLNNPTSKETIDSAQVRYPFVGGRGKGGR